MILRRFNADLVGWRSIAADFGVYALTHPPQRKEDLVLPHTHSSVDQDVLMDKAGSSQGRYNLVDMTQPVGQYGPPCFSQ